MSTYIREVQYAMTASKKRAKPVFHCCFICVCTGLEKREKLFSEKAPQSADRLNRSSPLKICRISLHRGRRVRLSQRVLTADNERKQGTFKTRNEMMHREWV